MNGSDTIERRVQRLERINLGLVITLGLVLTVGAVQVVKVPKEIKAERFVVVDGKGVERITMETLNDMAELNFPSLDGESSLANLGVSKDGSSMALFGTDMTGGILIETTKDASSMSLFHDRGEKVLPRIMLIADKESQAVQSWDKDGKWVKPR